MNDPDSAYSVQLENGSYLFDGVPAGDYVVKFTSAADNGFEQELGRLIVTSKDVNDNANDNVDSDVTGTYDNQILTSAVTDAYKLPTVDGIIQTGLSLYRQENVDMGLYLAKDPEIEKAVNGEEHADLDDRSESFTYTITTKVPLDATAFVITDTLVDSTGQHRRPDPDRDADEYAAEDIRRSGCGCDL